VGVGYDPLLRSISIATAGEMRPESSSPMKTRALTKADYDHVVEVIDRWWGGPISTFAHPIFFYELGEHALVAEENGVVIGFLLGFVSAPNKTKTGYVHLVGIHPDYRRRGVGRALYKAFSDQCRTEGCVALKAITTHANEGSIRFHVALGWTQADVEDYAGPSRKRLVFTQTFSEGVLS
jgi:GNAT superfamily N-acetyltransferase